MNVISQAAESCAAIKGNGVVVTHDQLVEVAELEMKRRDQRTFVPSIFQ